MALVARGGWPGAFLLTAALPLMAVFAGAALLQVPVPMMTRDIAGVVNVHPLTGFLSALGVIMWFSAAAIWLFTSVVMHARGEDVRFHLYSSCLTGYLGFDDQFEFHEVIAPEVFHIPEGAVMTGIMVAALAYAWAWRSRIFTRQGALLGASLGCLAASMASDTVLEKVIHASVGQWSYFVEDALKWIGICFWVAFCAVQCARDILRSTPSSAP